VPGQIAKRSARKPKHALSKDEGDVWLIEPIHPESSPGREQAAARLTLQTCFHDQLWRSL
jgi:hypothetical protein